MIDDKEYLFILGAGTSIPYEFPSGSELVQNIIEHTEKDGFIYNILESQTFAPSTLENFNMALKLSGKTSVDTFLEHRPDLIELGKIIITLEILYCEKHAKLYDGDPGNSLYHYLNEKLSSKAEDFSENRVAFITFNYDRSLEFFLYNALRYSYNLDSSRALGLLETVPIVHAHGKVGLLPFEITSGSDKSLKVEFGYDLEELSDPDNRMFRRELWQRIYNASTMINIMGEGDPDEELRAKTDKLLESAQEVLFLGFGYGASNLSKIGMSDNKFLVTTEIQQIKGTTMHLTRKERNQAYRKIAYPNDRIDLSKDGKVGAHEYLRKIL